MRRDADEIRKLATARSLKVEQVWINGVLRFAFRDSKGALRDCSTGEVLVNPLAALPSLLPMF